MSSSNSNPNRINLNDSQINNKDGSKKIIKKMTMLNPEKFKKMGLQDKLLSALSQKLDPSKINLVAKSLTTVTPPVASTITINPTVVPTVAPTITPHVTQTVASTITPPISSTVTLTVIPTITPQITPTVTAIITPIATPTITPTALPADEFKAMKVDDKKIAIETNEKDEMQNISPEEKITTQPQILAQSSKAAGPSIRRKIKPLPSMIMAKKTTSKAMPAKPKVEIAQKPKQQIEIQPESSVNVVAVETTTVGDNEEEKTLENVENNPENIRTNGIEDEKIDSEIKEVVVEEAKIEDDKRNADAKVEAEKEETRIQEVKEIVVSKEETKLAKNEEEAEKDKEEEAIKINEVQPGKKFRRVKPTVALIPKEKLPARSAVRKGKGKVEEKIDNVVEEKQMKTTEIPGDFHGLKVELVEEQIVNETGIKIQMKEEEKINNESQLDENTGEFQRMTLETVPENTENNRTSYHGNSFYIHSVQPENKLEKETTKEEKKVEVKSVKTVRQVTKIPPHAVAQLMKSMNFAAKKQEELKQPVSEHFIKEPSNPQKKVQVLSEVILPDKMINVNEYITKNAVKQSLTELIMARNPGIREERYPPSPPPPNVQTLVPPSVPAAIRPTFLNSQPNPQLNFSTASFYVKVPTGQPPPVFIARPLIHPQNNQPPIIMLSPQVNSPNNPNRIYNQYQSTILASTNKAVPSIVIDRSFIENDGNPQENLQDMDSTSRMNAVKQMLSQQILMRMQNKGQGQTFSDTLPPPPPSSPSLPQAEVIAPIKHYTFHQGNNTKNVYLTKIVHTHLASSTSTSTITTTATLRAPKISYRMKNGEIVPVPPTEGETKFLGYPESEIRKDQKETARKLRKLRTVLKKKEKNCLKARKDEDSEAYDADASDLELATKPELRDAPKFTLQGTKPKLRPRSDTFVIEKGEHNPFLQPPVIDPLLLDAVETVEEKEEEESFEQNVRHPKRSSTSSYSDSPNRNDFVEYSTSLWNEDLVVPKKRLKTLLPVVKTESVDKMNCGEKDEQLEERDITEEAKEKEDANVEQKENDKEEKEEDEPEVGVDEEIKIEEDEEEKDLNIRVELSGENKDDESNIEQQENIEDEENEKEDEDVGIEEEESSEEEFDQDAMIAAILKQEEENEALEGSEVSSEELEFEADLARQILKVLEEENAEKKEESEESFHGFDDNDLIKIQEFEEITEKKKDSNDDVNSDDENVGEDLMESSETDSLKEAHDEESEKHRSEHKLEFIGVEIETSSPLKIEKEPISPPKCRHSIEKDTPHENDSETHNASPDSQISHAVPDLMRPNIDSTYEKTAAQRDIDLVQETDKLQEPFAKLKPPEIPIKSVEQVQKVEEPAKALQNLAKSPRKSIEIIRNPFIEELSTTSNSLRSSYENIAEIKKPIQVAEKAKNAVEELRETEKSSIRTSFENVHNIETHVQLLRSHKSVENTDYSVKELQNSFKSPRISFESVDKTDQPIVGVKNPIQFARKSFENVHTTEKPTSTFVKISYQRKANLKHIENKEKSVEKQERHVEESKSHVRVDYPQRMQENFIRAKMNFEDSESFYTEFEKRATVIQSPFDRKVDAEIKKPPEYISSVEEISQLDNIVAKPLVKPLVKVSYAKSTIIDTSAIQELNISSSVPIDAAQDTFEANTSREKSIGINEMPLKSSKKCEKPLKITEKPLNKPKKCDEKPVKQTAKPISEIEKPLNDKENPNLQPKKTLEEPVRTSVRRSSRKSTSKWASVPKDEQKAEPNLKEKASLPNSEHNANESSNKVPNNRNSRSRSKGRLARKSEPLEEPLNSNNNKPYTITDANTINSTMEQNETDPLPVTLVHHIKKEKPDKTTSKYKEFDLFANVADAQKMAAPKKRPKTTVNTPETCKGLVTSTPKVSKNTVPLEQADEIMVSPISIKKEPTDKRSSRLKDKKPTNYSITDYFENIATGKPEMPTEKSPRKIDVSKRKAETTPKNTVANKKIKVESNAASFKCGNCWQVIEKSEWRHHVIFHNGLAWKDGIEDAIDLEDYKVTVNTIVCYMKAYRQPVCKCEKCGVLKKSAVGFISHLKVCGMTPEEIEASKEKCKYCSTKIMRVSMSTHLQNHCSALKKLEAQKAMQERAEQEKELQVEEVEEYDEFGRLKRKARKRAEKKIKTIVDNLQSIEDMILVINRKTITGGTVISWNAQFRKAKVAKCVFTMCNFMAANEATLREHHNNCPSATSEIYQCSQCKYQSDARENVVKHIRLKHVILRPVNTFKPSDSEASVGSASSDSEGESGVDEDVVSSIDNTDDGASISNKSSRKKKSKASKSGKSSVGHKLSSSKFGTRELYADECEVYRDMILDEVIEYRPIKTHFHHKSISWTRTFHTTNYENPFIFQDLLPNPDIKYMTFDLIQGYIPHHMRSARFMIRNTNLYDAPIQARDYADKWKQLNAFGAEIFNNEAIFFCGGPIMSMDWAPQPLGISEKNPQILALVCKTGFDDYFRASLRKSFKTLIQIWSVGVLDNREKKCTETPTLLYSIACDYGPIWQLQFCPSGCFNSKNSDNVDRLGLLAATTAHGDIYIYALDKNYDHKITNSYKIISLRPSLILTLYQTETSCELEEVSAVKLSWSKEKGHSVLAAGYANGVVAVWHLTTLSSLLTRRKKGVKALLPIKKIHLAGTVITSLVLHHAEASRYLLVTTSDRRIRIFDLKTAFTPIELSNTIIKSKVTCVAWPQHWSLVVFACDEAYALDRCAITLHQPRDIGIKMHPLYTFGSTATDLATNDWLSVNAVSTDGGDVITHKPTQLLHNVFPKRPGSVKYVLTTTTSVRVTETPTPSNKNYADYEQNYAVLFSNTDLIDVTTLKLKKFHRADLTGYPGTKVNKIAWNQNENSFHYYAIGYQTGFVRIKCLKI